MNERLIGKNNVIVTAHPDDEVLWAGGLPIRFWAVRWTVICCSIPRRDPIRAWKFFEACRRLNVFPRILPIAEPPASEPMMGLEVLGGLEDYDCLVTHNEHGEYGHLHHQQVHEYVKQVKGLRKFITFGYSKEGLGNEELELKDEEAEDKQNCMKAYDHVLPYENWNWPKWKALEHRYYEVEGINPKFETYRV